MLEEKYGELLLDYILLALDGEYKGEESHQNDLYMVVDDAETNSNQDNTMEGVRNGKISRVELVRNAANICRVLMCIGNAGR